MYDSVHSLKHFNVHDDIRIGSITAFRQLVLCFWFIYCDIFTFYVPDSNQDRTRNLRNSKLSCQTPGYRNTEPNPQKPQAYRSLLNICNSKVRYNSFVTDQQLSWVY